MEKREQFSIRKTHLGVGSVLIGIFLITGSVYADETTVLSTTNVVEPPVTVVEKDNSSVVTPENEHVATPLPISPSVNSSSEGNSESMIAELVTEVPAIEAPQSDAPVSLTRGEATDAVPVNGNEPAQAPLSDSQELAPELVDNGEEHMARLSATSEARTLTTEESALASQITTTYQSQLLETVLPNLQTVQNFNQIGSDKTYGWTSTKFREALSAETQKGTKPAERVPNAQAKMIQEYNANLTKELTVDSLVEQSANQTVQDILSQVIIDQNATTVWNQDKASILKGLYLLGTQYNFGRTDAVSAVDYILTKSQPNLSPLEKLRLIGSYQIADKSAFATLLGKHEELYTKQIAPLTGLATPLEFVTKLAEVNQLIPDEYVTRASEAVIQTSDKVKEKTISGQYIAQKFSDFKILLPLISQGKGAVVGVTTDTVTLGINTPYQNVTHTAGTAQTNIATMVHNLNQMENFNDFVRDASAVAGTSTSVNPLLARDSLVMTKDNRRIWATKEENDTVRHLLAPLRYDSPTYNVSSMMDGEKQSDSVFVAYNVPLLDGTWRGPSLYSHEMTHANDEKALFGGVYGQHGRRKGQGAEVYARGLFEAKDNTVLANGTLTPSFNLNTTLDIPEAKAGDIKMQFSTPAATVTALEQDGRRIMDLVQWMEAREAKVALETLSASDKLVYYTQVTQTEPHTRPQNASATPMVDQKRVEAGSTNDLFVVPTTAPETIDDLVKGNYVSPGFMVNGLNRTGEIYHNQYDLLPLLSSFYGADYADAGKNTVGDLTFRRNAHELLAYQGYAAMIAYLSDHYSSDQAVYDALKTQFADRETVLDGKLLATPEDTKIARYKELLAQPLKNGFEQQENLFTEEKLKAAIQADVAILKNTAIPEATRLQLANNVRKLKETFYSSVIAQIDNTPAARTDTELSPITRITKAERQKAEEAERLEAERQKAEEAARQEAERQKAEEAARQEAERQKAEEAARQEAERQKAEEAARQEAERQKAEEAARQEAERQKAEETARQEAERQKAEETARQEAERQKAEEAARQEAERQKAEEAARQEAERQKAEEAARQESERQKAEEAARQEAERQQAEESARQEAERQKAEEAARQEAERQKAEEAARQEAERQKAEEAARQEAERQKAEEAARQEAERQKAEEVARQESERQKAEEVARQESERQKAEEAARQEAERQKAEEAARQESERQKAEEAARQEAERQQAEESARQEAERQKAEEVARQEAERQKAEEAARQESERQKAEEAARQESERQKAEESARQEAERQKAEESARQEAERQKAEESARQEAERQKAEEAARQESEWQKAEEVARQEAERQKAEESARQEAERQKAEEAARQEAERQKAEEAARQEAERQKAEESARQEAERQKAEESARQEAERQRAEESARQEAERQKAEETARQEVERQKAEEVARQETERQKAEESARQEAERQKAEESARQEAERQKTEESARQEADYQKVEGEQERLEIVVSDNPPVSKASMITTQILPQTGDSFMLSKVLAGVSLIVSATLLVLKRYLKHKKS